MPCKTFHRRKIVFCGALIVFLFLGLAVRLGYLMIFQSEYYEKKAEELHQRERSIKAARGVIYDRNGNILAANETVCTISVIHNQVEDPKRVIAVLADELEMDPEKVRELVEKYTAREIIRTNVEKTVGDAIRSYDLAGVKVDEDYKRTYPNGTLASKVLGFTGSDNQGIIGLEVKYEAYLKGIDGTILTMTNARGIELDGEAEERVEPVAGNNLVLSLDLNIQRYCEQAAYKVMEEKQANQVSIIVMNPQNGEIYAMVNAPEFDLNDPFSLNVPMAEDLTQETYQKQLNQMWRNPSISDTYEPGSTFKIITMTAGLEEDVVSLDSTFSCPGFRIVADRRIRCHKIAGHGAENFVQGAMNSCNPVFIDVGARVGVDRFYEYFDRLGLLSKTGIDLPGEAATIMHKKEKVGEVELATISFGQSFQITRVGLLRAVSAVINGGTLVTPHFAIETKNAAGDVIRKFDYTSQSGVVSKETCEQVKYILEQVVENGSGVNAYLEGFRIGGKTATSEKLPRSSNQYISSLLGFAPANDPQVIALITIDKPEGVYYGGTIAAPVIADIFENILPYLGICPEYEQIAEDS